MPDKKIDLKFNEQTTLEEAVFQSVGAASLCWDVTPKGVFDTAKANQIGKQLVAWFQLQLGPDGPRCNEEIQKLADFIISEVPGEPREGSAADSAIREIRRLRQVLVEIDNHPEKGTMCQTPVIQGMARQALSGG